MKGYTDLRERAAWLDLSARGKIRVTGEDRARLLHAMTTNHVEQLKPGEGGYTFFLNAQGRILGDAHLLCFEDHFLLDTEPETREKLYGHLDRYIIADDVTLEDVTSRTANLVVEGPQAGEALAALGAPRPETAFSWAVWGQRTVVRTSYTGGEGWFVVAPAEEKADLISLLASWGVANADEEAFRVMRLEQGKPRYGEDISERYLAQETQQMHALNFSKGCYLGQEIVERVRSRAQIHRVLMPLRIDSVELPPGGTKLIVDGQPAAEITTARYSPALGKVVALAYVRVQYAQPGTALQWGAVRAEVVNAYRLPGIQTAPQPR